MNKTTDMKTESNTFTKRIGQTTYVVRFHYNENARETMQEKINRMLVNEVNRSDFTETEEIMAEKLSGCNNKERYHQYFVCFTTDLTRKSAFFDEKTIDILFQARQRKVF